MKAVKISLNSIDKVKSFCNDIAKFDAEFDLVSGRYVIDAKSIMGIFSLDISKPIELNIHAESGIDEIMATLKPYLAEEVFKINYIITFFLIAIFTLKRCFSASLFYFLYNYTIQLCNLVHVESAL